MSTELDRGQAASRRGTVTRALVAGVFLLLQLPLLFPLIIGAGVTALVAQIAAFVRRRRRGGESE
jgi:hypothetical protein